MNSEAFIDDFVSKPKINRLPSFIVHKQSGPRDKLFDKENFDNAVIKWAFLALPLLALLFLGYRYNTGYIDDLRLLALVNSTDEVIRPKESNLYFRDDDGAITGQMVKIAPDSEKTVPGANLVGNPNVPEKNSEKELMTIITKY